MTDWNKLRHTKTNWDDSIKTWTYLNRMRKKWDKLEQVGQTEENEEDLETLVQTEAAWNWKIYWKRLEQTQWDKSANSSETSSKSKYLKKSLKESNNTTIINSKAILFHVIFQTVKLHLSILPKCQRQRSNKKKQEENHPRKHENALSWKDSSCTLLSFVLRLEAHTINNSQSAAISRVKNEPKDTPGTFRIRCTFFASTPDYVGTTHCSKEKGNPNEGAVVCSFNLLFDLVFFRLKTIFLLLTFLATSKN